VEADPLLFPPWAATSQGRSAAGRREGRHRVGRRGDLRQARAPPLTGRLSQQKSLCCKEFFCQLGQ